MYDTIGRENFIVKLELGGTQNLKTVQYFIKYHDTNNYHGI